MTLIDHWWQTAVDFWGRNEGALVLAIGAALLLAVGTALVMFLRSQNRSKVVSTVAAVVVMAWTSEGLLAIGIRQFRLPIIFAVMTFFVFEAMMLAAALKAEEHRGAKGTPGPAGGYVFLLAAASGVITAFGAHTPGEVVLRLILPPLAVGLWWIFLVAERPGDKPEWKAERAAAAAKNDATWTVTPRTILVRVGLMKPGQQTVTQAQRAYLIKRMTAFGCTLYDWAWWLPPHWWAWWRLRRMARHADRAMMREVRRRVRRAIRAVDLVVPPRRKQPVLVPAGTSASSAPELPQSPGPEVPPEGSAPDTPEVPLSPQGGTSGGTTRRAAAGSSGGRSGRKPQRKIRRTAEETRKLIADLRAQDPKITQAALAAAIGISTRRVRDVDSGTDQTAKANGHHLAEVTP